MNKLSFFSEEEADVIISLPYRVGLHISYTEDEDGEDDDAREMAALESCIRKAGEAQERAAISREVAQAVLAAKEKWPSWSEGVFNIDPQCRRAVHILKAQLDSAEVKDYIAMILDIAISVAQAYGEFDMPEPEKGFFGKIVDNITSALSGKQPEDAPHPMNVSAAEDTAIKNIEKALREVV